jgi:hypothetical protein
MLLSLCLSVVSKSLQIPNNENINSFEVYDSVTPVEQNTSLKYTELRQVRPDAGTISLYQLLCKRHPLCNEHPGTKQLYLAGLISYC